MIIFFSLLFGCDPRLRGNNLVRQNSILKKENKNLKRRIRELERKMVRLKKNNFSLLFTGDILIANELKTRLKEEGTDYPFRKISEDIDEFDLVFGNLETPIARSGIPVRNKPYVFSLDPEYISALKCIQLDAVSLANNHLLDYGVDGMRETIKHLNKLDIQYSGAGENLEQARKPMTFQMGTTEILIFSYCRRPPAGFFARKDAPGTSPFNLNYIREDIAKYDHPNAIIFISLHWGIEQTLRPQKYQRSLAHVIINAGADAIIGHHPHWPQGIEIYKNRPIIYSLGNFVNGYYNKVEKDNIFAAFYFKRNTLQKIEILPVAGKNTMISFQPYIMKGKAAQKHLGLMKFLSAELGTRMKIRDNRGIITF